MAAMVSMTGWRAEFESLLARFGRLFARSEPREQAGRDLEGLLSAVKRKNGWQLAEAIGDARPWRTQRVLSHGRWDEEAARDLCREYVVEHLGGDDAALVVDEIGFLKRGRHSAGVARQYSGTAGWIENSLARSRSSSPTAAARGMRASSAGCTCPRAGPVTLNAAAPPRSPTTCGS